MAGSGCGTADSSACVQGWVGRVYTSPHLPVSTLVHRQLHCPFSLKGTVMRVLTERLKDREVDLTDGIKVFDERGWAQVLPDPDEPVVHVYAEGETSEDSEALGEEFRDLVEHIMTTEGAAQVST